MTRLLLFFLKAYQALSPLGRARCRFYPSCSHYAYEAVERLGPRRGIILALTRFARCRPWGGGGFDPVPER